MKAKESRLAQDIASVFDIGLEALGSDASDSVEFLAAINTISDAIRVKIDETLPGLDGNPIDDIINAFTNLSFDSSYRDNFMKHVGRTLYVKDDESIVGDRHGLANFVKNVLNRDDLAANEGLDITFNDGFDNIIGSDFNDTFKLGGGNDIVEAGRGNDILDGGSGDDTYIYNADDGIDTIIDNSVPVDYVSDIIKDNKLVLKGIQKEDVYFEFDKITRNVMIRFNNNENNYIILKEADGFFVPTDGKIKRNSSISEIMFYDTNKTVQLNDWIFMGQDDANSEVNANSLDNRLYGFEYEETFNGGEGNDIIVGGAGSDNYLYEIGDGFDTVIEENANSNDKK